MLGSDRAKLAAELDAQASRARRLETVNRDIARRLDAAIENVRAVLETQDRWITTASAPSFEEAAEFCTRSMIALLGRRLGLSPADAFGLMSIAADLRINQYCMAPKLGTSVRCEFPKLGAGITRA